MALLSQTEFHAKWQPKFAPNEFQNITEATFQELATDLKDSFANLKGLNVKMVKGATYPVPFTDSLYLIPPAYRVLNMLAVARVGLSAAASQVAGEAAYGQYPGITYQLLRDSAGDINALVDEDPGTITTVKARWVQVSGLPAAIVDSFPPFVPENRTPSYKAGDRFSYQFPSGEKRLFEVRFDIPTFINPTPTGADNDPNYAPYAPLRAASSYDDTALRAEVDEAQLDILRLEQLVEFDHEPRLDSVELGLAGKAPLNNADLTGTPTAPTAAPGNRGRQLANTLFVDNALVSLREGNAVVYRTGFAPQPTTILLHTLNGDNTPHDLLQIRGMFGNLYLKNRDYNITGYGAVVQNVWMVDGGPGRTITVSGITSRGIWYIHESGNDGTAIGQVAIINYCIIPVLHSFQSFSGGARDKHTFNQCVIGQVGRAAAYNGTPGHTVDFNRCTFGGGATSGALVGDYHPDEMSARFHDCTFRLFGTAVIDSGTSVYPNVQYHNCTVVKADGTNYRLDNTGSPAPGAGAAAGPLVVVAKYTRPAGDFRSGQDLSGSGAPNYAAATVITTLRTGPAAWFDAATSEVVIGVNGLYALEGSATPFDGDEGGAVVYNAPYHTPQKASYSPYIVVKRAGVDVLTTTNFGSGAFGRNANQFNAERAQLQAGDRVRLAWYSDLVLRVVGGYLSVTKLG